MNFIQEVSELKFSLCSEQIKSAIVSVLQKDENEPQDSRLSTTLSGLTLVVELECKDCSEHREHLQLCTNALPLLPLPVTIMRERHVLLIISEKYKVSDMIIASQPKKPLIVSILMLVNVCLLMHVQIMLCKSAAKCCAWLCANAAIKGALKSCFVPKKAPDINE